MEGLRPLRGLSPPRQRERPRDASGITGRDQEREDAVEAHRDVPTVLSPTRGPSGARESGRPAITDARLVLFDFDGPICRLFTGHKPSRC